MDTENINVKTIIILDIFQKGIKVEKEKWKILWKIVNMKEILKIIWKTDMEKKNIEMVLYIKENLKIIWNMVKVSCYYTEAGATDMKENSKMIKFAEKVNLNGMTKKNISAIGIIMKYADMVLF